METGAEDITALLRLSKQDTSIEDRRDFANAILTARNTRYQELLSIITPQPAEEAS